MRWLKLKGIDDDRFEVSEDGRIRYFDGKQYKDKYIMTPKGKSNHALNRSYVTLGRYGSYRSFAVDSIVANVFLGISLGTPIFHKDGDYTNNHYKNLSLTSVYRVSTHNPDEAWVDIHGYEGMYQISSYGNVRTLEHLRGKRLCPSILHNPVYNSGYLYTTLYLGSNHYKQFAIHRLVAEHFLDTPSNFDELEVNHKDFNTTNNYYKNLEWVTRLDNVRYSSTRGRMDNRKHPEAKLIGILKKTKPVKCIDTGRVYIRQSECESDLGLWNGAVQNCLKKGITSHGYAFCTVDDHSTEFIEEFRKEFHMIYPNNNMSDFKEYFEGCNKAYLIDY